MHNVCIFCKSKKLAIRYVVSDFHILQCKECGLSFVGEVLSKEELIPYYEKQKLDVSVYSDEANKENLKYYYSKIADHICQRVPTGKILDVGCSSGYFLDCMLEYGWECHGIEMDARYAERARGKHGSHISGGALEEYECPQDFFDVISMQDVLDHLPDPLKALAKCHDLLKPGGLLIVKVHDVSSLYARITGSKYYAILPPLHLVYFDRRNLLAMLEASGFGVEQYEYFPHLLFLKTVLGWLSPENKRHVLSRICASLGSSLIGKIRIKKNLFDIVTVFAHKK